MSDIRRFPPPPGESGARGLCGFDPRIAELILSHITEGVIVTDTHNQIVFVNEVFCRETGYVVEEVLGRTADFLNSGVHDRAFFEDMWRAIEADGCWCGEIWNRSKEGELFPAMFSIHVLHNSGGAAQYYIGLFDSVGPVRRMSALGAGESLHDILTGLPNRALLLKRLRNLLANSRTLDSLVAVCCVDLDDFKLINEAHGQEQGDNVLVETARRIKSAVRSSDVVARVGGDEFILLLADFTRMEEVEIAIERIFGALRKPLQVDGDVLHIHASIGVTVHPFDENDADTLLRHADQAMYVAKNMGRNTWRMHNAADEQATRRIGALIGEVRKALRDGELRMYYQPKVDLRSGRIIGMEALLRWRHPQRGLMEPAAFLPHVENSPLIIDIGEWVMREVLQQIRQWLADGLVMKVSINVAARQFQQDGFVDRLRAIFSEFPDTPPSLLEIEVLESSAFDDVEHVRNVLLECRQLGVDFALDDFGVGFATLTYLRRLPAKALKIDQSFIRDMLEEPETLALIEGVIGLARVFSMDVLAEGVESLEQGVMLMRIGCDQVQGYYTARPMPAMAVAEWCDSFAPQPEWAHWASISWDRRLTPLLLAERHFVSWRVRLAACLDDAAFGDAGGGDSMGDGAAQSLQHLLQPASCPFFAWWDKEGAALLGAREPWTAITPLQGSLFKLAAAAAQQHAAGDARAVQLLIEQMQAPADQLTDLLHAMQNVLLENNLL